MRAPSSDSDRVGVAANSRYGGLRSDIFRLRGEPHVKPQSLGTAVVPLVDAPNGGPANAARVPWTPASGSSTGQWVLECTHRLETCLGAPTS